MGRLKQVVSCGPSSVRIKILDVLHRLAEKILDSTPDQIKVFELIAHLFCSLLQDKNNLVEIKALEVFTYFAHVNSHESILALSVKNNESLQRKTKSYVQEIPFKPDENKLLTYNNYLLQQSPTQFYHKCKLDDPLLHKEHNGKTKMELCTELDVQPPKKLKLTETEDTMKNCIDKLKQEVNVIQNYCKTNSLSQAAKEEISQVSLQLKNLC